MFLGHYGLAFAAKRVAPAASLGATTFAAQWLDELWPILLLTGVEHVRIAPGITAANPLEFTHYPISHSLLMALLWGALIGGLYYALRRSARGAVVIGLLVPSHWLLDLPMHRPDLPLWPGSSTRVGLGMWHSIPLTIITELVVFLIGLGVYLRSTRARDRAGSWGLYGLIATLLAIYFGSAFGPPPGSERAVAIGALALWLVPPWAYWVDKHRESPIATPRPDALHLP